MKIWDLKVANCYKEMYGIHFFVKIGKFGDIFMTF